LPGRRKGVDDGVDDGCVERRMGGEDTKTNIREKRKLKVKLA